VTATRSRVFAPHTLPGKLTGAAEFSPDGNTLATLSFFGTVTLWDLARTRTLQSHPDERACSISGRGLDQAEWTRYVPGLPYQDTCA
jgi:WD40 repeat protein